MYTVLRSDQPLHTIALYCTRKINEFNSSLIYSPSTSKPTHLNSPSSRFPSLGLSRSSMTRQIFLQILGQIHVAMQACPGLHDCITL